MRLLYRCIIAMLFDAALIPMRCRVYLTVGCPSPVRPPVSSVDRYLPCSLGAVSRYRSTAAGARKCCCGQRHVESRCMKLNADFVQNCAARLTRQFSELGHCCRHFLPASPTLSHLLTSQPYVSF